MQIIHYLLTRACLVEMVVEVVVDWWGGNSGGWGYNCGSCGHGFYRNPWHCSKLRENVIDRQQLRLRCSHDELKNLCVVAAIAVADCNLKPWLRQWWQLYWVFFRMMKEIEWFTSKNQKLKIPFFLTLKIKF